MNRKVEFIMKFAKLFLIVLVIATAAIATNAFGASPTYAASKAPQNHVVSHTPSQAQRQAKPSWYVNCGSRTDFFKIWTGTPAQTTCIAQPWYGSAVSFNNLDSYCTGNNNAYVVGYYSNGKSWQHSDGHNVCENFQGDASITYIDTLW